MDDSYVIEVHVGILRLCNDKFQIMSFVTPGSLYYLNSIAATILSLTTVGLKLLKFPLSYGHLHFSTLGKN